MSARSSEHHSAGNKSLLAPASTSSASSRLVIQHPSDPSKQTMLRTRLLSTILTRALSPSVSSILVFTTNGSIIAASHPAPENARTLCTILSQLHASYTGLSSTKPVESIVLELENTTICLHVLHQSVLMAVFGAGQVEPSKPSTESTRPRTTDGARTSGERERGALDSSTTGGEWNQESNETVVDEQDEEQFLILKTRAETMATWLRTEMEGLRIPST